MFPILGYGNLVYWRRREEFRLVEDTRWASVKGSARTEFTLVPANEHSEFYAVCESLSSVALTVSGFSADKGKPCLLTMFPHRCETSGRRMTLRAEAVDGERQLFSLLVEA